MEPLTLITTALAAGASAAAQETAGQAIKDAYDGLKKLILGRFSGQPKAESALEDHAEDPETYEKPLQKSLQAAGAADDPAIIEAARQLMTAIDPRAAASGKYNVQFQGEVKGAVIGDHATQTNTFQ